MGHLPPTSGITQPPVIAIVMRMLLDADRDASLPRARALFPKVMALHRWWHHERCRRGFAVIVHPWESDATTPRRGTLACEPSMPAGSSRTNAATPTMSTCRCDRAKTTTTGLSPWSSTAAMSGGTSAGSSTTGRSRWPTPLSRSSRPAPIEILASTARLLGERDAELEEWADRLVEGAEQLWNERIGAYDSFDLRSGAPGGSATASLFTEYLVGLADETNRRAARGDPRCRSARACDPRSRSPSDSNLAATGGTDVAGCQRAGRARPAGIGTCRPRAGRARSNGRVDRTGRLRGVLRSARRHTVWRVGLLVDSGGAARLGEPERARLTVPLRDPTLPHSPPTTSTKTNARCGNRSRRPEGPGLELVGPDGSLVGPFNSFVHVPKSGAACRRSAPI